MPTNINDKLISWASEIDQETIRQAEKTARLPIIEGHVALMPDAHLGKGATVGSVIPTTGAIIPAAVGVDIGCGMVAAELDVAEDQLPDSLEPLLGRIEEAIPAGVGRAHHRLARNADRWLSSHTPGTELSADQAQRAAEQFGTLGSGNHFFELCVDERSRGGWCCTRVAVASGKQARADAHHEGTQPGQEPSSSDSRIWTSRYFMEGTPEFEAYIADMLWAQEYARANRDQMMDNAMREVFT